MAAIAAAVKAARKYAPGKPVEVEVENLAELEQALATDCDRVMLDNFSLEQIAAAVTLARGRVELEVSGNVTESTLLAIAQTGRGFYFHRRPDQGLQGAGSVHAPAVGDSVAIKVPYSSGRLLTMTPLLSA